MQNTENKNTLLNENLPHDADSAALREELKADHAEALISENEIASWSKTQLADKLKEYLATDDIHAISSIAGLVKKRYDELVKEEYTHKLNEFIRDGSAAEDFEPRPDPLDEEVEQIWKNLNAKRVSQRKQKEALIQENLAIKKMIIEELKELLKGNEKISTSYHKFQALQTKWRATGHVPLADNHTLKENYFFYIGKFYDMVKINNELNELDKKKNNEHKTLLCEKAEQLNDEPSLKKAIDTLRHLQEEWREIGNTTKEANEPLWQRFKAAADKIIAKQKAYTQQINQQQKENLAAKLALCVQMEQLLDQTQLVSHKACRDAAGKAEEIWEAWQKIGFVPKSDNGNCWKRFKKARQQFHHQVDAFYAKQRGEQAGNLEKKTALCIKAETLKDSTDWDATAEILKKLQAEWKTVGQVPAKNSDAIWNRFRTACNHFFDSKTNKNLGKQNAIKATIEAKEAIIAKVDALQPAADAQQSIEELKQIQEEWLNSGEIPLRENDRLNNAFGSALERLFERIKTSSQVDEKLLFTLKYEQMLKSPQGLEQLKNERSHLKDKINKLQGEVDLLENNLSFFGKSKNANPLIATYREQLEKSKLEIKGLQSKLKLIPYV